MTRRGYLVAVAMAAAVAAVWLVVRDPEPAPRGTTAERVRQELDRTGLRIRYREGSTGDGVDAVVAGFVPIRGSRGRGGVGFEFVLRNGERPDSGDLGRAFPLRRDPDTGAPAELHFGTPRQFSPFPRGVVGNVAYANYFYGLNPRRDEERITARLDDALFAAFPPDDAEAHPILDRP
jgi:hypothetical protein